MTDNKSTIDISKLVLDKVSTGKIKMRPKWKFLTEKIGLETSVLLVFVFCLFIVLVAHYYWEENEINHLLPMGINGWKNIIISFPHELTAITILLILSSVFIIRKIGIGFKLSFFTWLCIMAGAVFVVSQILSTLNLHKSIVSSINKNSSAVVKNYHDKRLQNVKNNNILGSVEKVDIKDDDLVVKISTSSIVDLKISKLNIQPIKTKLKAGEKIKMMGDWKNEKYVVWGVYILAK